MGNFLELLRRQREGDKASVEDLLFAADLINEQRKKVDLPDIEMASIPQCMRDEDNEIDWPVFITLVWTRARRDDPEITREEITRSVGGSNLNDVSMEIWYFFTALTREELKERVAIATEEAADAEDSVEKPPKNLKPGNKAKLSGSKLK